MRKYGESKTTRIMMVTIPHVTSGLGLRKFQDDGFLLTRVYSLTLNRKLCQTVQLYTLYCGESVEQFRNFARSVLLHGFGLWDCYIVHCHRPQMMLAVD